MRVAGLNGNARAELCGLARGEQGVFKGEDVVAQVFTGVGNNRQTGAGIKEFDS
jgi:hypothetical protein